MPATANGGASKLAPPPYAPCRDTGWGALVPAESPGEPVPKAAKPAAPEAEAPSAQAMVAKAMVAKAMVTASPEPVPVSVAG